MDLQRSLFNNRNEFVAKLFKGDCLEIMKDIPDGSVDMVLADLPYGTTACKWDTTIPLKFLWAQYERVTKESAAIVLFGSEPFSSHLRMSNIKQFKYDWIWHKNTVTGVATANKMPMKAHEVLSVFYRRQPVYNKQSTERFSEGAKARYKYKKHSDPSPNHMPTMAPLLAKHYDSATVNPRTVIEFRTPPNALGKLHPTQKPIDLLEYLIKTYTNEGDTVLDNTMGSGSTGVAAKNLGRNFIGIEKDAGYYKIAKIRIESA